MPKNSTSQDPLEQKLDKIIYLLQDLIILEGAKAGMKKEVIRKFLEIDRNRITKIWKQIKSSD